MGRWGAGSRPAPTAEGRRRGPDRGARRTGASRIRRTGPGAGEARCGMANAVPGRAAGPFSARARPRRLRGARPGCRARRRSLSVDMFGDRRIGTARAGRRRRIVRIGSGSIRAGPDLEGESAGSGKGDGARRARGFEGRHGRPRPSGEGGRACSGPLGRGEGRGFFPCTARAGGGELAPPVQRRAGGAGGTPFDSARDPGGRGTSVEAADERRTPRALRERVVRSGDAVGHRAAAPAGRGRDRRAGPAKSGMSRPDPGSPGPVLRPVARVGRGDGPEFRLVAAAGPSGEREAVEARHGSGHRADPAARGGSTGRSPRARRNRRVLAGRALLLRPVTARLAGRAGRIGRVRRACAAGSGPGCLACAGTVPPARRHGSFRPRRDDGAARTRRQRRCRAEGAERDGVARPAYAGCRSAVAGLPEPRRSFRVSAGPSGRTAARAQRVEARCRSGRRRYGSGPARGSGRPRPSSMEPVGRSGRRPALRQVARETFEAASVRMRPAEGKSPGRRMIDRDGPRVAEASRTAGARGAPEPRAGCGWLRPMTGGLGHPGEPTPGRRAFARVRGDRDGWPADRGR